MLLDWSALSDVGRVRKDNQDSGYAGPWLLTVCDGVGGAARGDVASSTAVGQLRRLDADPAGADLLALVAGALHRAHDRIAELVDDDPELNGTSTTATVALFDGHRLGVGHVGDSRAYLLRAGTLTQITQDHTFVQSLIDEGRITPAEARTHPHRNLILRALDAVHDVEPDLFLVDLEPGDRVLVCSDGVLSLDDDRIAALLAQGTPDFAAVELVRESLEAGSTDNVTCVVADVTDDPSRLSPDLQPLLVGAAADLPRRGGPRTGLFRTHRPGEVPEQPPVPADLPPHVEYAIPADPLDPEAARYAPRPPRRFTWVRRALVLCLLAGLVWVAAAAAWAWSQRQHYVAEVDGQVAIFRGLNADLLGLELSSVRETYDVDLDRLSGFDADMVRAGIESDSLAGARATVERLAARQEPEPADQPATGTTTEPTTEPTAEPTAEPSEEATP
nr:protein phosphatase 2C domain-containing protein [Nocardioides perillae]